MKNILCSIPNIVHILKAFSQLYFQAIFFMYICCLFILRWYNCVSALLTEIRYQPIKKKMCFIVLYCLSIAVN